MLLATVDVWEDTADRRRCRLLVFEDLTQLELVGYGRALLTLEFESVEDALRHAVDLKPHDSAVDPKAA
jgi:hypothetical protein